MQKTGRFLVVMLAVLGCAFVGSLLVTAEGETTFTYVQDFPTKHDPAQGDDYSSIRMQVTVYDALTYPDRQGNPQPHLAEKWEVSEDGTSYIFYLRPGVKFHDGKELTAEDAVFSMERMLAVGEGESFLFINRVKSIEALDKYTVKIDLFRPFGPFLLALYRFFVVNKEIVLANIQDGPHGEMGDYATTYLRTHDAGSGPYMVVDHSVGEFVLAKKFPDYWGFIRLKAPDYVRMINTVEPVTLRTMMARRELELSDQWQDNETLTALDAIEEVDVAMIDYGGVLHLMLHTRRPPTDCVHVRKAISWATDYDTILKVLYPGYRQAVGPVNTKVLGHDPSVFQYHYDLDEAKEELKLSKYYGSFDQYPIEMHISADMAAWERLALLLQASLAEIGLDARVVKKPWMALEEAISNIEETGHITPMFQESIYPDAFAMLDARYSSATVRTTYQTEWLLDPGYDAMLENAASAVSEELRYAKYAMLQHYIVGIAATVFVCDDFERFAYQSSYVDWPAARGEGIPVLGYDTDPRWIEVYPEKKP